VVFNLDGVVALIAYLVAVSAGAQGMTETVKNMVPWLMKEKIPCDPANQADVAAAIKAEGLRQGILKVIASGSAMALIALTGINPLSFLTGSQVPPGMAQAFAWGLLSSFGSPFLNSVLKIMISIRDARNAVLNKTPPQEKVSK